MGRRISNWAIRFILRRSIAVVVTAILISIPCVYWTTCLYGNLKPDLEELLPKASRSVKDLGEIRQRLRSIDNLAVLVFSQDPESAKRFTVDLAKKLESLPPTIISGVEYRIDHELEFFNQRKALFADKKDLEQIRNYIDDRISYEKKLYNPLTIFSDHETPEPKYDFQALVTQNAARAGAYGNLPGGFYATPDGTKRAVLVYIPADNSGIAGAFRLKETVSKTIQDLHPEKYSSTMTIAYTGGVQNTIEEYTALVSDIEKSAIIVFTIVTLALWLFFRSWLATGCLFFALFMARFWTFGLSWFIVGYLNANSAFMGSLLLGSGITFGVILLSRYLEERRRGRVPVRAAWIAMSKTIRPTFTAALAAGLAYSSLLLTEFEGFRQYGIIGLIGMIFCWISSITIFPALLVQVERIRPLVTTKTRLRKPWIFGPLTSLLKRYPGIILASFIALSVISFASLGRFDKDRILETNLANLRNKESMTKGSGYLSKYLDEIFQRFMSPMVILAPTQEKAEEIATRLREKQKGQKFAPLISGVNTIHQFIPDEQAKKIHILGEIRELLTPQITRKLSAEDRSRSASFLTNQTRKPLTQDQLPKMILDKFTEKDGSVGKLVLVEPPLSSTNWSGQTLTDFVKVLRTTGDDAVQPNHTPVAGSMPVAADMIEAITRDGPRATLFALLGVIMLITVLFRKPSIVTLMLMSLALGTLWLAGFILLSGTKINFLNFIAFPITFGIGIDYGVNIFHRYLHEPKNDILKVVRETGGAVGLCSFTTIVGYSSLLIARNQAFVSFGLFAVIGEVTSLLAAVVALPAFLLIRKSRSKNISQT